MKTKITLYYLAIFVINLLIAYAINGVLNRETHGDTYHAIMGWLEAAVYSLLICSVLYFVVFKHHKAGRG